jgi:GntR family transcriptional regulator, transcriptional repressor for pyruvate dehydrogenase complex
MNARAAADRRASEGLAELVAEMEAENDRDAFHELDTEFHVSLARASGNGLAPLLMQALRGSIARQMRAAFDEVDDWEATRPRLTLEHASIAHHVMAGDGEAAASTVAEHIRGFYRLIQNSRETEPTAFA